MFSARIQVRGAVAMVALCLAGVLLMTGCTLPWQHASTSSTNSGGPAPTAQQLISALQKNFRAVTAFHVVMTVQNAGTASASQIQIQHADGDILMPDKIKAQAKVMLSGQAVDVSLISIGTTQYITDPITGQWRTIQGVFDPRSLTNPDSGIISIIGKVQNLSVPVSDSVNGVSCWRVKGQLDAKYIAFFTGGGAPAGSMLETSACVGKSDSLPYQIIVTGRASGGDSAQTTRGFDLSNFNESLSIVAPA